jgi:hypothetical protein
VLRTTRCREVDFGGQVVQRQGHRRCKKILRDLESGPIHSEDVLIISAERADRLRTAYELVSGHGNFLAKAGRFAHAAGDSGSETLFDAIQAINITYMLVVLGNPMLGALQILHHWMLIPLTILLARAHPGFDGRRHRGTARRPGPMHRI